MNEKCFNFTKRKKNYDEMNDAIIHTYTHRRHIYWYIPQITLTKQKKIFSKFINFFCSLFVLQSRLPNVSNIYHFSTLIAILMYVENVEAVVVCWWALIVNSKITQIIMKKIILWTYIHLRREIWWIKRKEK